MGFGVIVFASAAWWSCSSSSAGGSGGGGPDGGEAGDDASDVTIEQPECNPCFQICACTPGDMVYSPTACMTFTCPPTGVWGEMGCTGPSKCGDASDEQQPPGMDATTEAAPEAASDAPADAPADGVTEAAEPSDASDASAD